MTELKEKLVKIIKLIETRINEQGYEVNMVVLGEEIFMLDSDKGGFDKMKTRLVSQYGLTFIEMVKISTGYLGIFEFKNNN